jgi:lysyl-tRNA synthetase class 2
VSTTVRVPEVALEPFIEPIAAPPGFLATSPELAMKRLLCRGSGSVFQVSHVFRQAEIGRLHAEEFHLLEWYRVGVAVEVIQADVEAVSGVVFEAVGRSPPCRWERRGFLDLVEELARVSLRGDEDGQELLALSAARGLDLGWIPAVGDPEVRSLIAWSAFVSEWSDRYLDPHLVGRGGVHVVDFPPALAALSEIAGGRAARFESYLDGIELANGYRELRDPAIQRRRFEVVAGLRAAYGLRALPFPEDFLADLVALGLPACSGVALGLDRLLMLASSAGSLDEISLTPSSATRREGALC